MSHDVSLEAPAARVRVEFDYDSESRNWCFHTEEPAIVGGAATLEEAEAEAAAALRFATGLVWEKIDADTVTIDFRRTN